MDLTKYHQLIVTIENANWFKTLIKNGKLEIVYNPYSKGECDPDTLGQFSQERFLFSCQHFAVTFIIHPNIHVDKNWHTLRHINQRNQITARIMGIIHKFQYKYLMTHDLMTLCHLPYQQIVNEYKRQFPERYMDPSIISRVIKNKTVLVNGYREILLKELFPRKSYLVGLRILKLLNATLPDSIIQAGNPLLSDKDLQVKLKDNFDFQLTRRYISYCRNLMGIPVVRLREKKHWGFFQLDSVDQKIFHLVWWPRSQRPQVCMCSV